MKTVTLLQSHEAGESPAAPTFFPRIIREFDDSDDPMYYG
jgi:hypothetical protein